MRWRIPNRLCRGSVANASRVTNRAGPALRVGIGRLLRWGRWRRRRALNDGLVREDGDSLIGTFGCVLGGNEERQLVLPLRDTHRSILGVHDLVALIDT